MSYSADTRVLIVDAQDPDPNVIDDAARVLKRGGLVAFPTETVYGLGANALDADAVARIFTAKGRPASDPLIVHLASDAQLDNVALDVPRSARDLAARFWPGPLTLVLRRHPSIPPNVAAGGDTVGVRVPSHPVARALLDTAGLPIAAPSANLFARPSPTSAQHVLDDLRGRVDVVLDGGSTSVGVESTVLDVTGETPQVLRPGGVPIETLREVLGAVDYAPRYLAEDADASAPGMLLKHYSPRAGMLVYAGERGRSLEALTARASELIAQGRRVGILAFTEDSALIARVDADVIALGSEADAEQIARGLFAALRDLDARGVDVILARVPGQQGLGLAVWDRLVRAAEGRVIEV